MAATARKMLATNVVRFTPEPLFLVIETLPDACTTRRFSDHPVAAVDSPHGRRFSWPVRPIRHTAVLRYGSSLAADGGRNAIALRPISTTVGVRAGGTMHGQTTQRSARC